MILVNTTAATAIVTNTSATSFDNDNYDNKWELW